MDEKFTKSYESFKNSLASLSEARERDMEDYFVLSEKFSITFDFAWKVMKDILVQYYAITGFVAESPREDKEKHPFCKKNHLQNGCFALFYSYFYSGFLFAGENGNRRGTFLSGGDDSFGIYRCYF